MPLKHNLIILVILSVLWSGCVSYAYYQSPLNANATTYRAIPLHSDSVKSKLYASGSLGGGGANYNLNDGVRSFSGSVHRSANLGSLQAHYGVSAMGGTYDVNRVFNSSGLFANESIDTSVINSRTGKRSYFAAGAFGGVNAVIPTRWGEWRVLGVDFSWFHEYGGYLRFRNSLPDGSANYIERRDDFVVLGLSTDFVWKTFNGSVGYKIDLEYMPQVQPGFDAEGLPTRDYAGNLAQTLHAESKKITAFARLNLGYHAFILAGGVNWRLGR